MEDSPHLQERSPQTATDWDRYFDLRWRVLRGPWNQPRGSERDDLDPVSFHAALWDGDLLVAAGRLHLNTPSEAQVRYMAVDPDWQNMGLGSRILTRLEAEATLDGAACVVLNARGEAAPFYQRHGYQEVGSAGLLFASIPHFRMQKALQR